LIGRVFDDRYEILRKIGSGGMAEVYLAHDRHLDRDVALKVLHSRHAEDESFIERFRREASNAASLNHPNIVQIYDRGEAEGTYYIAMEYLEGRPLKDLIVRYAPLQTEHVVSIATQILEALRFSHRKHIVHRDIKPQNIVVDDEGRVKVTDFGIARAGGASRLTDTGSILGTAHYLSPEQAQGIPVEAASDLYSLGVVIYEMATAHLPFTGDNPVAIAMQHVHDLPIAPRSRVPSIPENLEHVILRALAKAPEQRYLTADAFLEDLRRVQHGEYVSPLLPPEAATQLLPAAAVAGAGAVTAVQSTVARPAGGPGGAVTAVPRRRGAVWPWLLGLLFVLALAAGLYALFGANRPSAALADVPPLVGLTRQAAQAAAEAAGFGLEDMGTEPAEGKTPGTVLRQLPEQGARLQRGDRIQVWFAAAAEVRVIVPNLVGKSEQQASAELGQLGLVMDRQTEASNQRAGTVVRQSPPPETEARKDSPVTVWVSSGPEQVEVPNLVGRTEAEARAALAALDLAVEVHKADSDQPVGRVVGQEPGRGTPVNKGGTVIITVSSGPAEVRVPDLDGMTRQQAEAALRTVGLLATFEDRVSPEPAGTVVGQDPEPRTIAGPGDTVRVFLAQAPPTTTTAPVPETTTSTTVPTG